jgi:hypothetical protein
MFSVRLIQFAVNTGYYLVRSKTPIFHVICHPLKRDIARKKTALGVKYYTRKFKPNSKTRKSQIIRT